MATIEITIERLVVRMNWDALPSGAPRGTVSLGDDSGPRPPAALTADHADAELEPALARIERDAKDLAALASESAPAPSLNRPSSGAAKRVPPVPTSSPPCLRASVPSSLPASKPAPDHPWRTGKRKLLAGRMLLCEQTPGKLLTLDEAAKLCGQQPQSVRAACSPSSKTGGRCGGFTFNWAPEDDAGTRGRGEGEKDSAPASGLPPAAWPPNPFPRETRPRDRADGPINPFRNGGSAPVHQDPRPCPPPVVRRMEE